MLIKSRISSPLTRSDVIAKAFRHLAQTGASIRGGGALKGLPRGFQGHGDRPRFTSLAPRQREVPHRALRGRRDPAAGVGHDLAFVRAQQARAHREDHRGAVECERARRP